MIRGLVKDGGNDDVASEFRAAMIQEKEILEMKYKKNQNEDPFDGTHFLVKISVINRILDRIDELRNGGNVSRVQQIKIIHSALLST
uniref:Uncharacterized protein n=1 Tax=Caenorhabditis tropicalis TaxID=1561998 RepID=A0A1I7UVB2_9PELO